MRRGLFTSCLVVTAATAGLLRGVSVHIYKERVYTLEIPTKADRHPLPGAAGAPPAGGQLGYLTDAPAGSERAGRLRFDALYALAPRLLVADPGARLVVADLLHAEALPALCAAPRSSGANRWQDVAAYLLGALLVLLLLAWFKLRWAPVNDLVAATSASGLRARLLDPSRALVIGWAYLERLWRFEERGVALPLVVLSWPALWWTRRNRAPPPPAQTLLQRLSLLLPLAYAGIYLATPSDLPAHLDSSLDRLLLHWWPIALLSSLSSLPERRERTPG